MRILVLLAFPVLLLAFRRDGLAQEWDNWGDSAKDGLPDTPLSRDAAAVKDRPIGAGFTFSLGGLAREYFENIDQRTDDHRKSFFDPGDINSSFLTRERLSFEVKDGTLFRTFIEIQDARLVEGAGWGTVVKSARNNEVFADLYQAFAEVGLMPDIVDKPSLVFRVGRQELVLGARHLFSDNDWLNTGQTFDLARAIWRPDGFQIDAFAGWPAVLDDNNLKLPTSPTKLAGVNVKALGVPFKQTLETLFVYKWNNDRSFTGESGIKDVERLLTMSGRAAGRFFKHWDYDVEAAVQTGERGEDDVLAWNAFAQVGHTFNIGLDRSLHLAVQYSQTSGDRNPSDGSSQTYDPLFGDRFLFHSKLLAVGERNLDDLAARVSTKLWKGGLIELDYHSLQLNQAKDAFYQANGEVFRRDPTGRAGRDIGSEIDAQVTHTFHDNFSVSGAFFVLQPGSYFKRTGNHGTGDATGLFFVVRTSF